jgi:nicotinamidase-related amidase
VTTHPAVAEREAIMSLHLQTLPLPAHHQPAHARDAAYAVRDASALQKAAEAHRRQHAIRPVGGDRARVHLLVIDDQVDFSFPSGALYVAGRSGQGALEAQARLVTFVYRHLHLISEVTCTLDTHLPYQIFFPTAHLREDGSHPEPHTVITAEDYRQGRYHPNPAMARQIGADPVWLQKQFTHYCTELERAGKHQLYLWPYHCLLGSDGHRLAGVVEEMRLFHAFARGAADLPEIKGGNPLSERYSIFKEEVGTCWDGRPIPGAQKNTRLIQTLLEADVVLLAGLASSHCVKESIADLLGDIQARDPALARKAYILRDCTAPVVIPGGPDFTDDADQALASFSAAGMHVVDSTMPLETWPDLGPVLSRLGA